MIRASSGMKMRCTDILIHIKDTQKVQTIPTVGDNDRDGLDAAVALSAAGGGEMGADIFEESAQH